ncbi:MAG: nuclear transport factor 2 family protein [Acidimicrobiales bacterium]|jgi:steroid Delta-isomerase
MAETSDNPTPSPRETSSKSMKAITSKNRQAWLDLFTEDGVVEDPVGPSFLDPDGKGHRGKEAIAKFFDEIIAPNDLVAFTINQSYECANEVANVGTIDITLPGGTQMASVDLVSIYRIDADGRLISLRAFWESDKMRFRDL